MTQEEMLKRARELYECSAISDKLKNELESAFPELKESEDERIRKELIEQVAYIVPNDDEVDSEGNVLPTYQKRIDKYRAWLEKQGEFRSLVNFDEAEKEKDDFTTRKFLFCNTSFDGFNKNGHYWLEYIGDDRYVGRSDNILGMKFHITPRQLFSFFDEITYESNEPNEPQPEKAEKTIKNSSTAIENPSDNQIIDALMHELKEQDGILTAICGIRTKTIISWLEKQKHLYETTKDRFYREGFEEGRLYEKQFEQRHIECIKFTNEFENQVSHLIASVLNGEHEYNEGFVKYASQSLLGFAKKELKTDDWSEEDEKMLKTVFDSLNTYAEKAHPCLKSVVEDEITWLKALKYKVQPKQEWSEEDKKKQDAIIGILDFLANKAPGRCSATDGFLLDELIAWLKSLKDRVQPQPKQVWSEEDYNAIETIACHLDNIENEGMAEALRNIRDKYYHIILQSTWKPSEEQMNALDKAKNCPANYYNIRLALESLYNDLKKL